MSSISSRSVLCRQTSMTCAPLRTCRRAMSVASSHFSCGHQVLEQARADHVGPLADDQRAVALLGLHQFDAGVVGAVLAARQRARALALDHLRDGADVRRRGAAASAHDIEPAVIDELLELRAPAIPASRRICPLRWAGPHSDSRRCACDAISLQRADVVRHELRTGGAVQPHREQVVRARWRRRRRRRAARASMVPVRLDGARDHHRNRRAEIARQLLGSPAARP